MPTRSLLALSVLALGCSPSRAASGTGTGTGTGSGSAAAAEAGSGSVPVSGSASASVSGAAAASAPVPDASTPQLHVRARSLPVHAEPSSKSRILGTLAAGGAVDVRDESPRPGPGCTAWQAIAPRGWVCGDGDATTPDGNDPVWRALVAHGADFTSPWPYRYGESKGARRHRSVAGLDGPAWPLSVFEPHLEIPRRSTVAWIDEATADGVTWLRDSDQSFVRGDRVTPYERSDFQGLLLGKDASLPVAFFRRGPHAKLTRDASGRLAPSGNTYPRLGHVLLTGKTEKHGAHALWETRDEGVWIDARDAAIVAPEPPASSIKGTWVEVAALGGWLVAYEDDRPVFATMISAGKLGAAKPDPDHEPHQPPATTPIGTWHVREKLLTATLQSDLDDGSEYVHAEVPWSQRFYDKYLLHTAYWHDAWGEGHSGGCVNLSPTDARWLFGWTEPKLPPGWHAVRAEGDEGAATTTVVVHP